MCNAAQVWVGCRRVYLEPSGSGCVGGPLVSQLFDWAEEQESGTARIAIGALGFWRMT